MKSFILFALLIGIMYGIVPALGAYKMVCYYGSFSVYRPGAGKFNVENIDTNICTHIIYAFINADVNGKVKIDDYYNDVTNNGFNRFLNLKYANPNVKLMVSIGGGNSASSTFSKIANSTALINTFVASVFNFTTYYKFDGLDFDWEFPSQLGGIPQDKANFVKLLKALRLKYPSTFILSAAVAGTADNIPISYDVPGISAQLNFLNVMTYDMHNPSEPFTGANAALYKSPADVSPYSAFQNVNHSISNWIKAGAPASKLILGIPLYGHTYKLTNGTFQHGYGAPSSGPGIGGPFTNYPGVMAYFEIEPMLVNYTVVFDLNTQTPYAYKLNDWITYDDYDSIASKVNYLKSKGLGGAMVWTIDYDIFQDYAYPMINTINECFVSC